MASPFQPAVIPPNQTKPTQITPPLPTSRTLLTTLIQAIAAIPLTPENQQQPTTSAAESAPEKRSENEAKLPLPPSITNPLRRVPPTHRHLITTLHVLFPGLVLPALDLLERGFVARFFLVAISSSNNTNNNSNSSDDSSGRGAAELGLGVGVGGRRPDGGGYVMEGQGQGQAIVKKHENNNVSFYLVQSAAAAEASRERRRRGGNNNNKHGDGGGGEDGIGKGYIVRLEAWHCSCAAFAFAAVQGEGVGHSHRPHGWGQDNGVGSRAEGAGTETDMEWSFGGMSLDGLAVGAGEGVPVCKHLLACLLAERWSAALGRYVVERRVGREEMAGIVADV